MGTAYSKAVAIEMSRRKNKIPRKCRSRENRGPAAVKRTSSANSIRSTSNHKHKRVLGLPLRHLHEQTHYYNYYNLATNKPQSYTDTTTPSDSNPTTKSKVLIVNPEDKDDDDEQIGYVRKRRNKSDDVQVLEEFKDDFEEIEKQLAHYPEDDENTEYSRQKLRRFVVAWRAGLAYPHTRIIRLSAGIPIAATSYCRKGISWCKRYRRFCARCISRKSTEEWLENLLQKDSLERFIEETEAFKTTAVDQVIIRNDLGHKNVQEVAHHHVESVEKFNVKPKRETKITESKEDLTIEIHVDMPAPVHIEPLPDEPIWIGKDEKPKMKWKDRIKKHAHLFDMHRQHEEEEVNSNLIMHQQPELHLKKPSHQQLHQETLPKHVERRKPA